MYPTRPVLQTPLFWSNTTWSCQVFFSLFWAFFDESKAACHQQQGLTSQVRIGPWAFPSLCSQRFRSVHPALWISLILSFLSFFLPFLSSIPVSSLSGKRKSSHFGSGLECGRGCGPPVSLFPPRRAGVVFCWAPMWGLVPRGRLMACREGRAHVKYPASPSCASRAPESVYPTGWADLGRGGGCTACACGAGAR